MENITDALYIAFAVLAFVLALSICIGAFSRVTEVSQFMVDNKDTEMQYTYVNYQDENGRIQTDRIVSAETIIPAIYRSCDEAVFIRFYRSNGSPYNIFTRNVEGIWRETNVLNVNELINYGNKNDKIEFVDNLINNNINNNDKYKKILQLLHGSNFYDIISNEYIETLGVYYQQDLYENFTEDINKNSMRVITYTEV